MNQILKIIIVIVSIVLTYSFNAHSSEQQSEHDYCGGPLFPSSWTKIVPNGETVIEAKSENRNIRVIIRSQKEQTGKLTDKKSVISKKHCKYDLCIDIYVNGKKIVVADNIFCNLRDLVYGKIFIEMGKNVLILDGGDGASGFTIKIEFDQKRVTRQARYAECSMKPNTLFEETIYRVPKY